MSIIEPDPNILASRRAWRYTGSERPDFADVPGADQESVWDYPRPPRQERVEGQVIVRDGDCVIAETRRAVRVLETAGAPTVYIPPEDVVEGSILAGDVTSVCEWKGLAQTLHRPDRPDVGWRYVSVFPEFANLLNWPSFYPGRLACWLNGQRVQPQPGGYYGGWVTNNLVGPIKGAPGSGSW